MRKLIAVASLVGFAALVVAGVDYVVGDGMTPKAQEALTVGAISFALTGVLEVFRRASR